MELCMSHYNHKSMPNAKFEPGIFSIFVGYDVTKCPSEEGNESLISDIYPWKMGSTFLKNEFLCPESFFSEEFFSISKFLRHLS